MKFLKRKLKKQYLRLELRRHLPKKNSELYLNEIYLGQGTYGVASASLEYFDKSVKELNYVEASLSSFT